MNAFDRVWMQDPYNRSQALGWGTGGVVNHTLGHICIIVLALSIAILFIISYGTYL